MLCPERLSSDKCMKADRHYLGPGNALRVEDVELIADKLAEFPGRDAETQD